MARNHLFRWSFFFNGKLRSLSSTSKWIYRKKLIHFISFLIQVPWGWPRFQIFCNYSKFSNYCEYHEIILMVRRNSICFYFECSIFWWVNNIDQVPYLPEMAPCDFSIFICAVQQFPVFFVHNVGYIFILEMEIGKQLKFEPKEWQNRNMTRMKWKFFTYDKIIVLFFRFQKRLMDWPKMYYQHSWTNCRHILVWILGLKNHYGYFYESSRRTILTRAQTIIDSRQIMYSFRAWNEPVWHKWNHYFILQYSYRTTPMHAGLKFTTYWW